MNRIVASLSAAALAATTALAVAPAATAVTDTSTTTMVQAKTTSKDRQFLRSAREYSWELSGVQDRLLIRSGKQTCKTLKAGASAYDVIEAGLDAGLSEDAIVALISSAVVYYCPNQAWKFDS